MCSLTTHNAQCGGQVIGVCHIISLVLHVEGDRIRMCGCDFPVEKKLTIGQLPVNKNSFFFFRMQHA